MRDNNSKLYLTGKNIPVSYKTSRLTEDTQTATHNKEDN